MGDATKVDMGVCTVTFGGTDLGYTKGGVKCSFSAETIEKTVDQEDAPLDELISKQTFEVTVPLAEYNLANLADLLPGGTLTGTGTTEKLALSGAAGASLLSMAQELIITPVGGDNHDKIKLHYAIPVPALEFAYEKDNVRVYEVTFKALKGVNGWVDFGLGT